MIKIKGIRYGVTLFHEHDEDALSTPAATLMPEGIRPLGLIDQQRGMVYILSETSEDQREETLFHEVFHAITFNEASITEAMVGRISADLYAVFKDNGLLKDGWLENIIDKKTEEAGEVNDIDSIQELDRTEKEGLVR